MCYRTILYGLMTRGNPCATRPCQARISSACGLTHPLLSYDRTFRVVSFVNYVLSKQSALINHKLLMHGCPVENGSFFNIKVKKSWRTLEVTVRELTSRQHHPDAWAIVAYYSRMCSKMFFSESTTEMYGRMVEGEGVWGRKPSWGGFSLIHIVHRGFPLSYCL